MELSLEEIFGGVAIIHTDAFTVFDKFEQAYPKDYFVGAIEEKFGAFFDKDMINKLERELDRIVLKFEKDQKKLIERNEHDRVALLME